jgi:hypothetical protein
MALHRPPCERDAARSPPPSAYATSAQSYGCFYEGQSPTPGKLQPMFPVCVASVPQPAAEDDERFGGFREKFMDETQHDEKSAEGLARRKDEAEIQAARWAWLRDPANLRTFVNMLRVAGNSDDAIQAMCDGVPLIFSQSGAELAAALHRRFRGSLAGLKVELERLADSRGLYFVQVDSSVSGYSANALKGARDRPSKVAGAQPTLRVVVVGGGDIGAWSSDVAEAVGAAVAEWAVAMEDLLGVSVQLSFASDPAPKIHPWQATIPMPEDDEQPSPPGGSKSPPTLSRAGGAGFHESTQRNLTAASRSPFDLVPM